MKVATKRRTIGFDRKIQLDWLDATADWTAQDLSLSEIRLRLLELLEGQVAASAERSARDKTITVLLRVWVSVPDSLRPLRNEGLALLRRRSGRDRLPLHWGMCVSSYPYFRDVASTTGRLLALQGRASLSQITRRMAESWGERGTVIRTVRQIVRTFILWDVLRETGERGIYSAAPRIEIRGGDGIGPWLVESSLSDCDRRLRPLWSLLANPTCFPFVLRLSPRELASNPRLEVHRQGLDEDVVMLKQER